MRFLRVRRDLKNQLYFLLKKLGTGGDIICQLVEKPDLKPSTICVFSQFGLPGQITIHWVVWCKQCIFISYSSSGWKSKIKIRVWLGPASWFVHVLLAMSSHGAEQRDRKQGSPISKKGTNLAQARWSTYGIPALRRLRQEDREFKDNLGNIVRPCLKKGGKGALIAP
jgi:hypothetical protein